MQKDKKPIVGRADGGKVVPTPTLKRASGTPRWLLSRIDLDGCGGKIGEGCDGGLFGWHALNRADVLDVLKKLQNLERATWQSLEARGSHFLTYEKLSKQARDRIAEVRIRDTDRIYSLRTEGDYRFIGLRYEDDFFVVWCDPLHKFCPSHKRS
jgi:hypothetical protein